MPIPTDKPENVEKAFLILEDWAHGLSFNDVDIDAERAIILEELRLGKGAQDRMNKVLFPKIFGDTLYAKRLPIGTEDSLKGFRHESIKRFYKDWYRPDLMAVMVVGDIDPQVAKAQVEAHFGGLKNPDNERPRAYPKVPARSTSEAVVVTDKEATHNVLTMYYPVQTEKPDLTLGDYRRSMVEHLFSNMLGQHLQELTQQAMPPFVSGGGGVSKLVPGYRSFGSYAVLGRQGMDSAVSALVQEIERVRQFGFTPEDLERGKKPMLRNLEQAFAEREKTDSIRFVEEYTRNFLDQESIPGIENELAYTRELLPTISVTDVNQFARSIIADKAAKLVTYTGSDKPDSATPTQAQLLSSVSQAEQRKVVAKDEKPIASKLLAHLPAAGRIVAQRHQASLDVTEWDLSNGIKVLFKPTDFKNDEILMGASRFGGQSLFGVEDKFNAGYASAVVGAMGVGDFAPVDLQKMLAGKVVRLNTGLGNYTDVVSGASSQADLETMLQLLTLKFGPVRRDAELYQSFVDRSQDAAKHAIAKPESVFFDAVTTTLFNGHPRVFLTARPEDFDQIKLDRVSAIYQQRFASAKGLTFIFVGSVTPETLKPLVERYIASLPTPDLTLNFSDLGVRPVKGVVKKEVHSGSEPKSQVALSFAGTARYSDEEQLRVQALVDVVNIRMVDVLREKLTLIYGGGLRGGLLRTPYEHYQLGLNLPCAPENVDKVVSAALAEIQNIQEQGVDPADLAKFKLNWFNNHRKTLRENSYWLRLLDNAVLYGTDPAKMLDYGKMVEAITPQDVQTAARRYLNRDNYVQVLLYPEK